jgi:glycosyltransferase involved in cell wall biosynthesis
MDSPQISVIVAAYNCEAYIQSCVRSITTQSFKSFELIICEDGSSDRTWKILNDLAQDDPRIRLLQNPENRGLPSSLNACIEASRGNYIARLDADDVALPDRLEVQYRLMTSDSGLVLTGSNVLHVDPHQKTLGRSEVLLRDGDLRAQSFFQNPFVHPTAMFRRDVVLREALRYRPAFETTQDWDLWIRLMQFGRIANIPNILVHQMVHDASISKTKRALQVENSINLQMEQSQKSLGTAY